MGCTSAKPRFREALDGTRAAFKLDCDKDYTTTPAPASSDARAQWFAEAQLLEADQSLVGCGRSGDPGTHHDHTVSLAVFLPYAERQWRLSGIHPFLCVWPARCATAIATLRSATTNTIVPSNSLAAWELRTWMLMTSEGLHVLALLEETKSLPKAARKVFSKLQKASRPFPVGQFPTTQDDLQRVVTSTALVKLFQTCAHVAVAPKHLTKAFLQQLTSHMPTSLSALNGPGEAVPAEARAIVKGAAAYWQALAEDGDGDVRLMARLNPLQTPTGSSAAQKSAVAPSSGGCCGGGAAEQSVPLLGLVEWLSLRRARACQGAEENAGLHTSSLPNASTTSASQAHDVGAEEEASPSPSPLPRPRPAPSPLAVKTMSTLERLAWVLRRLREIEAALSSGTLPHAERVKLGEEKAALEAELQAVFEQVTEGRPDMTQQDGRDGLYAALSLSALFPIKAVHDGLSDCAYASAIGYDDVRDRSDAPGIQNLWRFRLYLTAYLALTDLYGDVVTHHGVAVSGDAVDPLHYDTFFPVLQDTHARDPGLLDTVPVAGDHQGDPDTGRIISLFQRLARMKPGDERTDHLVDFTALCQFVAQRRVAMYTIARHPLLPLEALREELVIAEDTESRDLDACAARLRRALEPLPGEGYAAAASAGDVAQTALVDTLVAQTSLFNFTYASAEAADEAVVFSALVERTLAPAAGVVADHVDLPRTSANPSVFPLSAPACASWLARVRAEKKPLFANVVAYSLYASTTVYRCVDDTKSILEYDAVAHGTRYEALAGDTPVAFEWFLAALTYISDALQLDTAALVANASNLLEARDTMMKVPTADASAANGEDDVEYGEIEQEPGEEAGAPGDVTAGESPQTPTSPTATTTAAHVTRAFADMVRFNKASHTTTNTVPHRAGRLSSNRHASSPAGHVRLRDLAYVCVFHYTQAFFGDDPALRLFFSSDAYSAKETRQLDADDAALRALLAKMPLDDEALAYAEFFALTGGKRAVCAEDIPLHADDEVPVRRFCAALFERYKDHLSALNIDEEALLVLCREALDRVGTEVPDGSGGTRRLLFAKDYRRFLQYIAGTLLAQRTYDALNAARRTSVLDADGQPIKVVDTTFVRRLLYFLEKEHGVSDEDMDKGLSVSGVFDELLQRDLDLYGGVVTLQTASVWYGQLRAAQTPQCVLDWCKCCAEAIPWTHSAAHNAARDTLEAALVAAMADALGVSPSSLNPAAPWASLGDGYLPRTVVASTLRAQYPDLYWAATLMHEGRYVPPPLSGSEPDAAAAAVSDALWGDWVRACVEKTNALVARDDLADSELHVRDMRLLLAYMHHHASVFFASGEAQKEVRAMRTAAGQPDPICRYSDADFQRTLMAQLTRLLGATVSADALSAAMTALQQYGAAHTDEAVSDDALAHLLAFALVQHTERVTSADDDVRREEAEAARLKEFEREVFLGTTQFNASRSPCGTYWERLRLILPSGDSQKHRQLRREIFQRMDVRRRGYLTMSDIYQGALDVLHLEHYRADVLPVLFRAFFATHESDSGSGSGRTTGPSADVVFLDADGDRVLLPRQLRMFFGYVYRYMELYFMFDTLTASECVDGRTLHVTQTNALPSTGKGPTATGIVHTSAAVLEPAPAPRGEDEAPYSDGDALFLAAESPYRLTAETANLPKEVSLVQFTSAHRVLRHWGVRVRPEETEDVFLHISRRCREQGAMYFTAFAIWASERNLRPEGYAHDHATTA